MAKIRQGIPDEENPGPAERAGVRLSGGPPKKDPPRKDPPNKATARPARPSGSKGGAQQVAAKKPAPKRAPPKRARRVSGGLIALVSTTVVIIVVGIIVAASFLGGSNGKALGYGAAPAPADIVTAVTGVPASVLDQVGLGKSQVIGVPDQVKGSAPLLSANGKPEVVYVGAEYCPFCAAERWSMVQALSRFGTFSGLKTTHSSSTDVYPNTQTFSFYGSTYTSKYLSFAPVELTTNQPDTASPSGYVPLQTPTSSQQKLLTTYDVPPYTGPASSNNRGTIPFLDVANRYIQGGASYQPSILQGLPLGTIAGSLSLASSPVAQGIDGGANYLTAAICNVTHDQPASVCSAPYIAQAKATLAKTP